MKVDNTISDDAFLLTPKHVTQNDHLPFCVKFCFALVRLEL